MISLDKYMKKLNFNEMTEFEKIKHVAYYLFLSGIRNFKIDLIVEKLNENGYYISNLSRMKNKVKESKLFKKTVENSYTLTTVAHSELKTFEQYFDNEGIDEVELELLLLF